MMYQAAARAGQVAQLPVAQLERELGAEQGLWLARMARGEDGEPVVARLAAKSIGCGKSFRAHLLITSAATVRARPAVFYRLWCWRAPPACLPCNCVIIFYC